MMGRTALFVSIAVLCLHAAESKAASCDDLKSQVEALKKENADLKTQLADGGVSFVTAQAIVDGAGNLAEQLGVPDVSAVVGKVGVEVSKLNVPVGDLKVEHVTDAVYSAYDVAKGKLSTVASVVQDQHDQHVLPHASEYYDVAKPVVGAAQDAYYKNVAPQIAQAYDAASVAGTGIREKMKTMFEQSTLRFAEAFAGQEAVPLKKLYETREITILGWKKVFRHGVLDMALFLAQVVVNLYVGILVLWMVLKNIGFRGFRLGFKLTKGSVKTTFGLSLATTTMAFRLVFWALSWIFTAFWLFIFCALGLSMMHGIEKSAKLGIDARVRMMAGLAIGFLIFLPFFCCCCCKKRKKEDKAKAAATNGNHNGKAKAKPAAKKEEPKPKASATQAKSKAGKK